MRVISGKYKGGKLNPPLDQRIRPTTDRIKETIFNDCLFFLLIKYKANTIISIIIAIPI